MKPSPSPSASTLPRGQSFPRHLQAPSRSFLPIRGPKGITSSGCPDTGNGTTNGRIICGSAGSGESCRRADNGYRATGKTRTEAAISGSPGTGHRSNSGTCSICPLRPQVLRSVRTYRRPPCKGSSGLPATGSGPRTARRRGVSAHAAGPWRAARTPPGPESPSERVCRTVCRIGHAECVERIVPLGEGHLRAALRAFAPHYHEERPHQGLGHERIAPTTTVIGTGPVTCRERLGGVLTFYYREAA